MAVNEGSGFVGHLLAGLAIAVGLALAVVAGSIFAPDLAALIAAGALAGGIALVAARFSMGMVGWSAVGAVSLALLGLGAIGTMRGQEQTYVLSEPDLLTLESVASVESAPITPQQTQSIPPAPSPKRKMMASAVEKASPEASIPPPPPPPAPIEQGAPPPSAPVEPAPKTKERTRGVGGIVATAPAPAPAPVAPPSEPVGAPTPATIGAATAERAAAAAASASTGASSPLNAGVSAAAEPAPVLMDGRFSVNTPNPLAINRSAVVEVEIGLRDEAAPTDLGNGGEVVTRDIAITNEVEVDLITTDFDVKPMTQMEALSVAPGQPARWAWELKPRSAGPDKSIKIYVYGVTSKAGEKASRRLIKTHEETIKVTITPAQTIQRNVAALAGGLEPIAGVISAIGAIGGFLVGLLGWRRKRLAA
jgi:hypothetical protein